MALILNTSTFWAFSGDRIGIVADIADIDVICIVHAKRQSTTSTATALKIHIDQVA